MDKSETAFRTIGELSEELGIAPHILRYWETRFPQLRPLQRAGNRRYYRPADVALARRIDTLLHREGYTIKGVQKLLGERPAKPDAEASTAGVATDSVTALPAGTELPLFGAARSDPSIVEELRAIRDTLAAALREDR